MCDDIEREVKQICEEKGFLMSNGSMRQ